MSDPSDRTDVAHMSQLDFPAPQEGFVLTHFLVVYDQDRSREFYRTISRVRGMVRQGC